MNLLILGRGKTGSLVAQVANERRHKVHILGSDENQNGIGLTAQELAFADVVLDFTTPQTAVKNSEACVHAGKNMVVGTTGWYGDLPRIREMVQTANTGFVYGTNFSIGVNIFFEIATLASAALQNGYSVRIMERHHAQKKDSPSGTAVTLQKLLQKDKATNIEITSIREGDTVGQHVVLLDSPNDTMMLVHDAKSRRGFAEGAIRAAEWLNGKRGFFEFREIFSKLT